MMSGIFKIKMNARAMLTANIDLQDRLGKWTDRDRNAYYKELTRHLKNIFEV